MKTQIKVFVVDNSNEFTKKFKEYFENNNSIEVVNIKNDGESGLQYIIQNESSIDVIIMDLILPEKDGIEILKELQRRGIQKHIIIVSSCNKDLAMSLLAPFKIDYFMLKPCNLYDLEHRIIDNVIHPTQELYATKPISHQTQVKVSNVLHDLGVPSQIKGYAYLREAILMLYQSSYLTGGITKHIYPEIADKYHTTTIRVERAIRHAIEISWTRADMNLMNDYFGNSIDKNQSKPTNSEFLFTISDSLRVHEDSSEIYR